MIIHKICKDCGYGQNCTVDLAEGVRARNCVDYYVDDFDGDISYSQPKYSLGINTNGEINYYHFLSSTNMLKFMVEELKKKSTTGEQNDF